MANPYTITIVAIIPISGTIQNLVEGRSGRVFDEPSRMRVYATRETIAVTIGIDLGRETVLPAGSVTNINATNGTLPSRQDDLLVETVGNSLAEILIQGVNSDGAATRELRLLIDVVSLDDVLNLGL